MTTTKKITKATFKSFVKKAGTSLLIKQKSSFDGMVDGVVSNPNASFGQAVGAELFHENNLGIQGVWLVGGSRNYFNAYEKDGIRGIEVWNCCGSFVVGVKA